MISYVVARKLMDVPYVWAGRDLRGADCYGLCRLFAKEALGEEWPEFSEENPASKADLESIRRVVLGHADLWTEVEVPSLGCVVLIDGGAGMGIFVDDKQILSTDEKSGPFTCSLRSFRWQRRLTGFFRFRG